MIYTSIDTSRWILDLTLSDVSIDRTHQAASNDISFEKWHHEVSNICRKYEKRTF
ncbi:unnamed protein product, partial [Rotaria magnacalcarata]